MEDAGQARFEIAYGGPAFAQGRMDVRDLAKALLSVGTLFDATNHVVNGDYATIGINVRAMSASSFEIHFEVFHKTIEAVLDSEAVKDAAALLDLIFGATIGSSVTYLIRRLGRQEYSVAKVNDELYKLTTNDGQTYEVPISLLRAFQDATVRSAISDFVGPLRREGVDWVQWRIGDRGSERITKEEVATFDPPMDDNIILDETSRKAFSIASLSFKDKYKWRLDEGEGGSIISAAIMDKEFLAQIDRKERSFTKGDILVCELRTIQRAVNDRIKTEYEITRVLDYQQPRQRNLPLSSPPPTIES